MTQILADMSILSEVQAARAGDVIHGGEKHGAPRGPRESLHDQFARRYRNAPGPMSREACRREAELALESVRRMRAPKPSVDPDPEHGSFYWKCRIADDVRPLEEIAQHYTVSRATIYRYRAKYRGLRVSVG